MSRTLHAAALHAAALHAAALHAAALHAAALHAASLLAASLFAASLGLSQVPAVSVLVPGSSFSGMYAFLREGEFVQLTVEDKGRVTGFVSRFGDSESDRGVFLDHFFKSGALAGNRLTFTTDAMHGVAYDFHGTIDRGEGKNAGDEAYYVLTGTLVINTTDDAKKTSAHSQSVVFKSFPRDMSPPAAAR